MKGSDAVRWICKLSLIVVVGLAGCKKPGKKLPKREITIVRVAWTGVTIKSAIASELLKALGYRPEEKIVSLPLAFSALAQSCSAAFPYQ